MASDKLLDQVCLAWDLMSHRPAVHEHGFLAATWSPGCRGEPDPVPRRDGPDRPVPAVPAGHRADEQIRFERPSARAVLLAVSIRNGGRQVSFRRDCAFKRASADAGAPTILLGRAPSDRGRRRPPRPRCLASCRPVSPVALPGSAEPCCCYMFCYTPETPKALFLVGKGP